MVVIFSLPTRREKILPTRREKILGKTSSEFALLDPPSLVSRRLNNLCANTIHHGRLYNRIVRVKDRVHHLRSSQCIDESLLSRVQLSTCQSQIARPTDWIVVIRCIEGHSRRSTQAIQDQVGGKRRSYFSDRLLFRKGSYDNGNHEGGNPINNFYLRVTFDFFRRCKGVWDIRRHRSKTNLNFWFESALPNDFQKIETKEKPQIFFSISLWYFFLRRGEEKNTGMGSS